MDNMQDLAEALAWARSPSGRQLIELLRKNNDAQIQNALEHACSGDFAQAKDAINAFLATPDAKALLEQLGGEK